MKKENLAINFKSFYKMFLYMLPNVLVGIFTLVTANIIFGSEYAVLGILILLYNVITMGATFSLKGYIKDAIILISMVILATISAFNIYTSIIFNFIVPFLLIMLFSDELSPGKYMSYGLFFVIMQSKFPSTLDMIPTRILATIYGLTVLLVFKLIMKKISKKEKYIPLLKKAFSALSEKVILLVNGEIDKIQHKGVDNITDSLNGMLYTDIASKTGILNNKEEIIFQTSITLDGIDKIIDKIIAKENELTNNDKEYLIKFNELISEIGKNYDNLKDNELIKKISEFVNKYNFSDEIINNDFNYILTKMEKILIKYNSHEEKEIANIYGFKLKFIKLKRSFTTDSCFFRFAIKVSIILCAGFTISHFIPLPNGYWLPCTAFALIQPYYENTKQKMSTYLFGTLIGAILFILIFQYVPTTLKIILITLILTLMFSLPSDLLRNSISCQLALVAGSAEAFTKIQFLEVRIAWVCFGILLAFIIDKFILHTKKFDGVRNNIDGLLYKDRMLIKDLRNSLFFNRNSRYLQSLLLESYVLQSEIVKIANGTEKISNPNQISDLLQYNRNFILETEKLINIINNSNLNIEMKEMINETLNNMEKILMKLQKINNGDSITNSGGIDVKYNEEYIKNNILSCKSNIENMSEMLIKK